MNQSKPLRMKELYMKKKLKNKNKKFKTSLKKNNN